MRLQAMTREIYNVPWALFYCDCFCLVLLYLIFQLKLKMSDQATEAYFSVTEAEYAAGKFQSKVLDSIGSQAEVTVESTVENVAGVKLPVFHTIEHGEGNGDDRQEAMKNIGLGGGGKVLHNGYVRSGYCNFAVSVLLTPLTLKKSVNNVMSGCSKLWQEI